MAFLRSPSRFRLLREHDVFRKPVPTFRHHAHQARRAGVNDPNGRFIWYELQTTDVRAAGAFYTRVMGWGAWDASVPGRDHFLFSAGPAAVASLMSLTEEAHAR